MERTEGRPGHAPVKPYAVLVRGWKCSETVLEAVQRGAMLASEALAEGPGDAAMDEGEEEERGEGWVPPLPTETISNPFTTVWDAEYEQVDPPNGVETGLEVIMGTGANLTELYLTHFPGMGSKDPRMLAIRPTGAVTQAYEDNLGYCLGQALAKVAPEATLAWISLDSTQYMEKVRLHDIEQTKRLWIAAQVPLRQSEVVDMLLDVVSIAPTGMVPATFTCPTNGATLHVMECVWASVGPKQEVLDHGAMTLRYRRVLSQAELLAIQVSGPDAMDAVVFPSATNASDKPWILATHEITQQ